MLAVPKAPPFVTWLNAAGPEGARTLSVVDVGCAGGLPRWLRSWPGDVQGVGADGNAAEIARLREGGEWWGWSAPRTGLRWEHAVIGLPDFERTLPDHMDRARWKQAGAYAWQRSSSAVAQRVTRPAPEALAAAEPPPAPNRRTLDALAADLPRVDVLKVDTDGHDLEVLRSGPDTLARALVVDVEVQLQGLAHPDANTFANIDNLLRSAGFDLFDLRLHRHSRAQLPAPSWGPPGAPTYGGQTVWGEAFYARDVVRTRWSDLGDRGWTLAALFELAGLPDCAVELVRRGFVPGANDLHVELIARSWWRDGGRRAARWLVEAPERLRGGSPDHLRERVAGLAAAALWRPWRQ